MPLEVKVLRTDGVEELHTCDHLNYTEVLPGSEPTRRSLYPERPLLEPGIYITLFESTGAAAGRAQTSQDIVLNVDGEVAYIVNAETRKNSKVLSWPPRARSVSAPAAMAEGGGR